MTDPTLVAPRPRRGRGGPGVQWSAPFARLAVTHSLSMAGDALLAIALAGSLFFSVDPSEGRQKVLLGLLLTMAPFAIVSPLIGPLMDRVRGGHRAMIVGSLVARAALAAMMFFAIADDSVLLFPEAFGMLVLSKTYQVAKAAVVPTVVGSDAGLVEANSKLQVVGGLSGFVAALPAGLLYLFGPEWVAAGCAVVFSLGVAAGLRIPGARVATSGPDAAEISELRSAEVVTAASSMAVIRALVGFVTMLLAFELRGEADLSSAEILARNVARQLGDMMLQLEVVPIDEPPRWYFGVIVALSVGGSLVGASLAPRIRRMASEERMLTGSLTLCALAGVAAVVLGGLPAYALLAFGVAVSASSAKQAFDALVQQDAPDANRGRSFARFEARFQVAWVMGAFVPVALRLPLGVGGIVVMLVSVVVALMYAITGFPQWSRSGKSGISGRSSGSGSG